VGSQTHIFDLIDIHYKKTFQTSNGIRWFSCLGTRFEFRRAENKPVRDLGFSRRPVFIVESFGKANEDWEELALLFFVVEK
jgi:hypothetical protein